MTDAQKRALAWVVETGGGVVDKYGRLLCAGETKGFDAATFLRLCASGYLAGSKGRIVPTVRGIDMSSHLDRKSIIDNTNQ